jgi:hypothetical protein
MNSPPALISVQAMRQVDDGEENHQPQRARSITKGFVGKVSFV